MFHSTILPPCSTDPPPILHIKIHLRSTVSSTAFLMISVFLCMFVSVARGLGNRTDDEPSKSPVLTQPSGEPHRRLEARGFRVLSTGRTSPKIRSGALVPIPETDEETRRWNFHADSMLHQRGAQVPRGVA